MPFLMLCIKKQIFEINAPIKSKIEKDINN